MYFAPWPSFLDDWVNRAFVQCDWGLWLAVRMCVCVCVCVRGRGGFKRFPLPPFHLSTNGLHCLPFQGTNVCQVVRGLLHCPPFVLWIPLGYCLTIRGSSMVPQIAKWYVLQRCGQVLSGATFSLPLEDWINANPLACITKVCSCLISPCWLVLKQEDLNHYIISIGSGKWKLNLTVKIKWIGLTSPTLSLRTLCRLCP